MAILEDRFQPNFSLFPINNNRTGWQPVNLPLVLFVPYRRTESGFTVSGTEVTELEFLIEEAPGQSKVAGFQNRGLLVPNYERFKIQVSSLQLADVRILPEEQIFYDQDTGLQKEFEDVRNGDLMQYGMLRSPIGAFGSSDVGPIDTIPYYQDADYFDLSPFIIETFDLPIGRYNFVWRCRYNQRIISPDGELVCISENTVPAAFKLSINHPGEVHNFMNRSTPSVYFTGQQVDNDATIAFYRPYADALQDIFDEQELLRGINWIDRIPAQYIPYLSYLIGFDMPYFPSSTDDIRRALLRNGKRLQQLKGSKRAIRELFEIFGFTIDLANLWYSKDGTRFIAPNESLPDTLSDQEITTSDVCQIDPILNGYSTDGFGQIEIPLLFRPLEDLTVDAYFVTNGSQADLELQEIVNNLGSDVQYYENATCQVDLDGYLINANFPTISNNGLLSHSTVLINQETNSFTDKFSGRFPTINSNTVTYDFDRNSIDLTFDHYLTFRDQKLYVFTTYSHRKIVLPEALEDLRSNRFDINVLTFKDGTQPTSDIFDFLVEFLFRFKAFHSLLRKITFTIENDAIYNVIDFCLGGQNAQSADSDLGNLQTVPNPVIPSDIDLCDTDTFNRGFKDEDISYRRRIRELLEQEHQTWKDLDGTHEVPESLLPTLQSLSRITIRTGSGEDCEFTQYGQDRVYSNGEIDYDHEEDPRGKLCDLEGNTDDYCYRGRVQQELLAQPILTFDEIVRCKPCT